MKTVPNIHPVSFDLALELILKYDQNQKKATETIELKDSAGRTLASDVFADIDFPGADISAMDGYCLSTVNLAGAGINNLIGLPILAGIDAGHKIDKITPGSCAYIATGGMLPSGADSVVKIEDVEISPDGNNAIFSAPAKVGNFIRPRATELRTGDIMVAAGTQITPFVIGQLATAGQTVVQTIKKPKVAIITSGDEVLMPWEKPQPWQVRNGNCPMLRAQVEEAGAIAFEIGIARDVGDHALELFLKAAECADIIVTSGGISMGRKDPFKQVFARLEIEPVFYGIKMKPGKPVFFGSYKNKPVFGLPGNQTSTAVTFELLVRPYIRKILGLPNRLTMHLKLSKESINDSRRDFFKRGHLIEQDNITLVQPLESQESHMLSSLAGAEILFLHPANDEKIAAGSSVKCWLLKG
ncbi:MAG: molybdopterin molybdotransferase MoeA [Candidatus Riflebacteria bacterium]|nr:molybdopterin molybdotransferase MoeA [Candidatus Riflebacteria bacterium]